MNSNPVKAIIVEDDKKQAALIKSVLPEYYETQIVSYSDAINRISPAKGITTVVIMNADDKNDRSLSIFKHLCNDPQKCGLKAIPVVLYTNDQFSDSAFAFYDYGEPLFHEGVIDDAGFFTVVNEAVENAEDYECEELYEQNDKAGAEQEDNEIKVETSPDKLMGMKFRVSSDDEKLLRIAAYGDEQLLEAINRVTKRSIEKAEAVRAVVEETIEEKIASGEIDSSKWQKNRTKNGSDSVNEVTHNKKVVKQKLAPEKKNDISKLHKINDIAKISHLLKDDDEAKPAEKKAEQQKKPEQQKKTASNVIWQNKANASQGNQQYTSRNTDRKLRILVVDEDPMTIKACTFFLGDMYEFIGVDSNMKAVDYFIKNYADVVFIEYDLPVRGTSILNSIRMQPNGRGVRAAIMVNEKKPESDVQAISRMPGVMAILKKPVVKKQLIQTINRCCGR